MRLRHLLVGVAVAVPAAFASAQGSGAPPALTLPMGARVRLQTAAAPGSWMKGVLASADRENVALVPEGAPPLGANQLRLPTASLSRFEMVTGKKRRWLPGLVAGAALGLLIGATAEVDPVACEYDINYECSRGEALALYGGTMAVIGAGVGALIKADRWTPVALDALAPPAPRTSGIAPRLRAVASGGMALEVAVGF